jgi:hypothetical protein
MSELASSGSGLGALADCCEVKRSPPSSVEVKNEWSCTSTPSVPSSRVQ